MTGQCLQAHIYYCADQAERLAAAAVIQRVLGSDAERGQEIAAGLRITGLAPGGTAVRLARKLIQSAPRCSFILWQAPEGGFGDLAAYTWQLGPYAATCDSDGVILLESARVAHTVNAVFARNISAAQQCCSPAQAQDMACRLKEAVITAVTGAYGQPWLDDWAARTAGAADPPRDSQ